MSEQVCVCGGSKSQPNRDCERCQLIVQRGTLLAACVAAAEAFGDYVSKDCTCPICKAYAGIVAAIALTKETSE